MISDNDGNSSSKHDDHVDFNKIEQLLKNSLNQKTDSIDAVTSAKLSAARHRALEQGSSSSLWLWPSPRISAIAALSVCVLILSSWFSGLDQTGPLNNVTAEQTEILSDMEILASNDSVEFYESLEFLLWLENAPEISG